MHIAATSKLYRIPFKATLTFYTARDVKHLRYNEEVIDQRTTQHKDNYNNFMLEVLLYGFIFITLFSKFMNVNLNSFIIKLDNR